MRQLFAGKTSVMKTVGLLLFALNIAKAVYAGYKNAGRQEIIHEIPEQKTETLPTGSLTSLAGVGMVLLFGALFVFGKKKTPVDE
jgi:hypothetical protein